MRKRQLIIAVLGLLVLTAILAGCGGGKAVTFTDSSGKAYTVMEWRAKVESLYDSYNTASEDEKPAIAKQLADLGITPKYDAKGNITGISEEEVGGYLELPDRILEEAFKRGTIESFP